MYGYKLIFDKEMCSEIYTVEGRLVMQTPVEAETTLDLSGWKGGLYILRVGSRSEKLIVK